MAGFNQYPSLPWDSRVVTQIRLAVQKPKIQEEFWAYYVLRRISIYFAIPFSELPLFDLPNFVTIIGIVSMAIAAGLASQGSQTGLILACLFYQLGYLMDCVDGEVARLTNRCSRTGKTLDTILDGMNIILLSGFAFGVSCYSRGFLTIGWFYFVIFAGLISFAVPRILHLLSQRQSKMSSHNNDSAITTKLRHASILFDLPAFIFSPSGFYTYTLIVLLSPFGNVIPIILKVYAVGLIAKTVLRIIVFGLRSNIQKALDTKIPDTLNPEHQPFGQAKNIGA